MTAEQFERERRFRTAVAVAQTMLDQGIIDAEDFKEIQQIMIEKYNPFFGGLSPKMS